MIVEVVVKSEFTVVVSCSVISFFGQIVKIHFNFIDFVCLHLCPVGLVRWEGLGVYKLELCVCTAIPFVDCQSYTVIAYEYRVIVII